MEKIIREYFVKDKLDIDTIVNDFSGYIYTIIKNSINDFSKEDYEEIISDVFFTVWKNQERLEKDRIFTPYLAGITKVLIKEKKRKHNPVVNIDDYSDKLESEKAIDISFDLKEEVDFLEDKINKYSNTDLNIFRDYYYEDMSIRQISIKRKLSEVSVKSRLYRIRKKLKKDLKEGGYDNGK